MEMIGPSNLANNNNDNDNNNNNNNNNKMKKKKFLNLSPMIRQLTL